MPPLAADGAQLAIFFDVMFRYADEQSFISLRAFYDDRDGVFSIAGHPLPADTNALLLTIERFASLCAAAPSRVVFCPPVATFRGATAATEADLVNGLALSVECDSTPAAARLKLESLIGPATVVVESGGEWIDPETGEVHPKQHLHWRLSEPTRCQEDHQRLKHARVLATSLVGGDASNKPIVHPIRWPGSWHRKALPRLTRIAHLNEAEIDLNEALDRLLEAATAAGCNTSSGTSSGPHAATDGESRNTAELIRAVLTATDYHAPLAALAMRFLLGGMADSQAVLTLRGIMLAIPEAERDLKEGVHQPGRWQTRYDGIPRAVSTARAKCSEKGADPNAQADTSDKRSRWGDPVDFLADGSMAAPTLERRHVPDALWPFIVDSAKRMGVDPSCVALAALVSCSSVISDDFEVQPKRNDYTWVEQSRLWGAIVGEPSILKTPIISACTKPIVKLEAEARQVHREQMRVYREACEVAKAAKPPIPFPPRPKMDRFMVESVTPEALSEVLRDDDEAKFNAPLRKVLSRHDEMSEFFGGLDRYKAGGKGGSERGSYLRLYNGGPHTVDRIGRGSFAVSNWSATFLGGVQPGPIQRIARDAADDGLLQRFMFAVPSKQDKGADVRPDQGAVIRYGTVIPALAGMRPARDFVTGNTQTIVLADGAHEHRDRIDTLAEAMTHMPDTSTRLVAAFGKWSGLFARLCLTFHLIDVADAKATGTPPPPIQVIQPATAERVAAYMCDILLPHLLRAEAVMFSTDQTGHARWVAGFILAHRLAKIGTRDIVRSYRAFKAPEAQRELIVVMRTLVSVGWLEPEEPSNPAKPVTNWMVNPAVHTLFAARAQAEQSRRANIKEKIADTADFLRAKRRQA